MRITRPQPDEYAPYYATYIDAVLGDCALTALKQQCDSTSSFLAGLPATRVASAMRPASGSSRGGWHWPTQKGLQRPELLLPRNDQTPCRLL